MARDYAGIGGLMATAMKYRGLAGAVIDGSVRDTPQIRKLQFPVFSRGVAPSTTINHYRVRRRQRAGDVRGRARERRRYHHCGRGWRGRGAARQARRRC